ncbi:hypothetical protein KHP62_14530 [Rhodobacteraceae bacterium NNCM2]|nr:hypothetical protein [Coraliihabitans acroporae]
MAKFYIGDLVVLKSGSMRMCVEDMNEEADTVSTVWCNEGVIGRDTFATVLLNKWEHREEKGAGGGRSYGGDRDGGGKPYRGGGDRGGDRGYDKGGRGGGDRDGGNWGHDKPRKQGWDGKPRDKKYYRSDD